MSYTNFLYPQAAPCKLNKYIYIYIFANTSFFNIDHSNSTYNIQPPFHGHQRPPHFSTLPPQGVNNCWPYPSLHAYPSLYNVTTPIMIRTTYPSNSCVFLRAAPKDIFVMPDNASSLENNKWQIKHFTIFHFTLHAFQSVAFHGGTQYQDKFTLVAWNQLNNRHLFLNILVFSELGHVSYRQGSYRQHLRRYISHRAVGNGVSLHP